MFLQLSDQLFNLKMSEKIYKCPSQVPEAQGDILNLILSHKQSQTILKP